MRRCAARLSTLVTVATILVVPQGAQAVDPPGTLVIPPGVSLAYREDLRRGTAASGVLHAMQVDLQSSSRLWWTGQDGAAVDLGPIGAEQWIGTGADVMVKTPAAGATQVEMRDLPSGTPSTIPLSGSTYRGAAGRTVIASEDGTWSAGDHLYLLDLVGGSLRVRQVTGLPEATGVVIGPGDAHDAVVFTPDIAGLIDLETAAYRQLADLTGRGVVSLTSTHLVWRQNSPAGYWAVPRSGGTPFAVTLPSTGGPGATMVGWVGDRLLAGFGSSGTAVTKLVAAKADGTGAQVLLDKPVWLTPLADGTALVAGGLTQTDRHIFRITATPSGDLTLTEIYDIRPVPARTTAVALGARRLFTRDDSAEGLAGWRELGPSGVLVAGPRQTTIPSTAGDWGHRASGNGVVWKDGGLTWAQATDYDTCCMVFGTNRLLEILSYTGRFAAYSWYDISSGLTGYSVVDVTTTQWVYSAVGGDFFAVWGTTLWTMRGDFATSGVLVARSLQTGNVLREVTLPARCPIDEVSGQVTGRWIYWYCRGMQGVKDQQSGRHVSLTGSVEVVGGRTDYLALSDGFVVWMANDGGTVTGTLMLADLTQPTVAIRQIASGVLLRQGVGWAVDKFGGQAVAYVANDRSVHAVPTGIPASSMSLVDTDVRSAAGGWRPYWDVSKPGTWQLTVSGSTIGTEYTTSGTTDGTAIRPGLVFCNCVHARRPGKYRLVVTPADGVGAPLVVTGSIPAA